MQLAVTTGLSGWATVVAAVIALIGALFSAWMNYQVHEQRRRFDEESQRERHDFERAPKSSSSGGNTASRGRWRGRPN